MNININEYVLNQIGDTSWLGETHHDNRSSENLEKLDKSLYEVEELREQLISRLNEHIAYNKYNASSNYLHKKAKSIRERHIIKEFTHTNFEKYFEGE